MGALVGLDQRIVEKQPPSPSELRLRLRLAVLISRYLAAIEADRSLRMQYFAGDGNGNRNLASVS
jgi:hypothetical protein